VLRRIANFRTRCWHSGRLHEGIADFRLSEKIVGKCSFFVLDLRNRTIIISAIPLHSKGARRERQRDVAAGCGGPLRCRALSPRGLRMERPGAAEIEAIDADASGGRSKCMSGRQSARTRHVSAKATIPGDMQQAEKSIRVRNAGEDLLPSARFGSAIFGAGLDHRSCAIGMRAARSNAGAAGAALRPVVPHAPSGETDEQDDRLPQAGQTTGAMTRV
jgi:hypothetical protein